MVSRAIDIAGQTFNRFTVLERAPNVGKHAAWKCRCACGTEKIIIGRYLITGRIKSCGCYARNRDVLQPITTDGMKICRVCKEAKPLNETNWFRRETSPDGFRNECRECFRLKQERYNQSEERKVERKAYDQEKRATDPEWVAKQAAYVEEWRKQNPNWRKQHESQPHVKERKKKEWQDWYDKYGKKWAHERWENNPEYREYAKQYGAMQRADPVANARIRDRFRTWASENRDKILQYANNRRALELNAEGFFTAADLVRILTAQEGICFYCDKDIRQSYTVDHFIPLSLNGTNHPENIRLCCKSCNSSKHNKIPSEFTPKIKRY